MAQNLKESDLAIIELCPEGEDDCSRCKRCKDTTEVQKTVEATIRVRGIPDRLKSNQGVKGSQYHSCEHGWHHRPFSALANVGTLPSA